MYKRVFIVAEGQWGMVTSEEYKEQVERYRRILEEAKDFQGNRAAEVTIIDTIAEAEKRLATEADVVVFISRGVEKAAERIVREHPRVRVIVFTGLIPEGKIVWVRKMFTADRETIQNIVLHW